jgi:hypothetical protein
LPLPSTLYELSLREETLMSLLELRVYEHHSIPEYEAWLVRRADAEEVPPELRGCIAAPCIITGDAALLAEQLTLLHLAEAFDASEISPPAR